ncbi:hypothetical protein SRABI80_00277 [Peribacillus frigoritolerans]|uniref:hypothetical protein n=1 Tax=Peribacillus frigoritolerans TaxID=450367 RepID=UPI001D5E849E|nr:hypothetical protein [Peribacillus frigoritolerans]ULM97647.1 hypothetical protein L8956_02560 [Peribacillus frigoritolerans]CAH0135994.1 hypothetical protein SRABI80_00277 [Peribacillus frigoritolerans]
MEQTLLVIKDAYVRLVKILTKEKNDLEFIISQAKASIELIDACLLDCDSSEQYRKTMMELSSIYRDINKPRVGLSDYFIWHDNYDKRIVANNELDEIKDILLKEFKSDI